MSKFWRWVAYRLPHDVVYFAVIRAAAVATTGPWSHQIVPDLRAMDVLDRWGHPR